MAESRKGVLEVERDRTDVAVEADHVRVTTFGLPSLDDVRAITAQVDDTLRAHGLRAVVFDTRKSPQPPSEVRDAWWAWLSAAVHHERIAIVATSELTRVSGNMTALSRGARVRAFGTVTQAVAWLRGI